MTYLLVLILLVATRNAYPSTMSCNNFVTYQCRACLKLPDAASSLFTGSKVCADGPNHVSYVSDDETILADMSIIRAECPDSINKGLYVGFLYNQSTNTWFRRDPDDRHAVIMPNNNLPLLKTNSTTSTKGFIQCSYLLNEKLLPTDCDSVKTNVKYVLCERRESRCGQFDDISRDCQSKGKNNVKFKCRATHVATKPGCKSDWSKLKMLCPFDNSTSQDCFTGIQQASRSWAVIALGVVGLAILAMGTLSVCFVTNGYTGLRKVRVARIGLEGSDMAQFQQSVEILRPLSKP